MSSTDKINTALAICIVIAMMYGGYLKWITRASQNQWSTEQTIRYALGGLFIYVMATCLTWQSAVTQTPRLNLDVTELQNAEDPNSLLVERVDQFNFDCDIYGGQSQFIRAMTMCFVFGGLVSTGQILAKRYCRDDLKQQLSTE